MKELEEVILDIARDALADQERLVAGIRLRTGTLVAAHALVASFLGTPVLRDTGLTAPAWLALTALTAALTLSAVVLWPWDLRFSLPASRIHGRLERRAAHAPPENAGAWMLEAAWYHEQARTRNRPAEKLMARCSGGTALLLVVQTLAWLAQMA